MANSFSYAIPFDSNTQIPFFNDALFWLNGEIFFNAGNYYFRDKTGNNRHFLITGLDYDPTIKGILYKSKLTISAPNDAVLIANDINNYFFTGGVSNQIPVNSIFYDIDYFNKSFSRHLTQIKDINNVETFEPRVIDFVLYQNVKVGADLTTCQAYYNVLPEVTVNVKWIDPVAGNDLWAGTKAAPWKTLGKGDTAAAGTTIYIKSGTCNVGAFFQNFQNSTWICTGLNNTISTGGLYVIISNANVNMSGFNFNGQNLTTTVIFVGAATIFNRCKAYNSNIGGNSIVSVISGSSFINCIIPKDNGIITLSQNVLFDTCLINTRLNISATLKTYSFYNNKFVADCAGLVFFNQPNTMDCEIIIKGGLIEVISASIFIFNIQLAVRTKNLTITYTNILITALTTSFLRLQIFAYDTVTFSNNTLINNSNKEIIINDSDSNFIIENNHITINGNGSGINIIAAGQHFNVLINNNTILMPNTINGYGIGVGNEATSIGDNTVDNITITNNKLLGIRYFNPLALNAPHGIFIGFQGTTVNIKFNKILGYGMAIPIKGNNTDYANCFVLGNILANGIGGFVFSGADNCKIYQNVCFNNLDFEIFGYANIAPNGSNGLQIINNIFVNSNGYIYKFDVHSQLGHTINYNCFYFLNKLSSIAGIDINLIQWNILGFDLNSINSDPLLTNFIPSAISPAKQTGQNLGIPFNNVLNPITNWGNDPDLPNVVTELQGAFYDMGAYKIN